jgi:hypothetical protein
MVKQSQHILIFSDADELVLAVPLTFPPHSPSDFREYIPFSLLKFNRDVHGKHLMILTVFQALYLDLGIQR